jgi:hypothetical protein
MLSVESKKQRLFVNYAVDVALYRFNAWGSAGGPPTGFGCKGLPKAGS